MGNDKKGYSKMGRAKKDVLPSHTQCKDLGGNFPQSFTKLYYLKSGLGHF